MSANCRMLYNKISVNKKKLDKLLYEKFYLYL